MQRVSLMEIPSFVWWGNPPKHTFMNDFESQALEKLENIELLLSQVLNAVAHSEAAVGVAVAAEQIYGDGSRNNQQKLTRRIDNGTLRESIEWRDDSGPESSVRKPMFYVNKCIERLNTPKHQR